MMMMTKTTLSRLLSTLALVAGCSSAVQAAPVTWTFADIGVASTGTTTLSPFSVSGRFDFDGATHTYSNVDIRVFYAGNPWNSFDTADVLAGNSSAVMLLLSDSWGSAQFYFTNALPYAYSSGRVELIGGLGERLPFLTNLHADIVSTTTGTLPEPGSLALAALGLIALGRARRSGTCSRGQLR